MNKRIFGVQIVAALLIGMTLSPIGILFTPRPAHAQFAELVHDPINWIQENISAIFNGQTAASTAWTQLKGAVLDPLAHALAQAVLKQITASVVNSINGVNGSPQYVTNLATNLQQVGDTVGLSFISQFGSSNNSPFAPAIGGALQQNYLQQTSLAGFFAANQCTLSQTSPNINGFLGGNFTQGGIGSWFSLTGPNSNNPFVLYSNANSQLASVVGNAQGNQKQTVAQNNGFLSWCPSGTTSGSSGVGQACTFDADTNSCPNQLVCTPGAGQTGTSGTGTCAMPTAATSNATEATCYNADGTPATVQTPGSVIESTLTQSLGSGVSSLVSVQDFNEAVDTILSALATKVVSTGLSALSGSGSGALSSSATGSTDPNAASIASGATTQAQTALSQLASYTSSWQTMQNAAETASSSLQSLINNCSSQASAAETALNTEVQPVIAQAQQAYASASTTAVLAQQVETDATNYTSGAAGAAGALTVDTQALAAAPPSATDIANAQANATSQNGATSSPFSLTVSGGTTLDQMNLLSQDAQNLELGCGILAPI